MRSRDEWEQWYGRPDPWHSAGSDDELYRAGAICARLRNYGRFRHILELGCGEGNLADALSGHGDRLTAYDISENALVRARRNFPHIEFRQGDLLDVVRRPEVRHGDFDLVVAAEVLYYLPSDAERRDAIAGIAGIGVPECLYYFSVIVTGASAGRRYFTHDEFVRMLSAEFSLIEHFPTGAIFPALADGVLRAMPFRHARLQLRKRLIDSSQPARWKHVGYIARKRGATDSPPAHRA